MSKKISIYCDGGSRGNPGPAASAFVVIERGKVIVSDSFFLGEATNNVAEYTAVYKALLWLAKSNYKNKENIFYLDSELVVNQLNGNYKVKSSNLIPIFVKSKRLLDKLPKTSFVSVPRNKNELADSLVNSSLDENTRQFYAL